MATTVAQIMARDPRTVQADAPVRKVARLMREGDTGEVIVPDGDRLAGTLTDGDIAVRVVAEGRDATAPVRDACSSDLTTVTPDTTLDRAAQLMRAGSVRRLPVVDGGRPAGVVSIGDLAIEREGDSALAEVSAAEGNA